jgi:hypothetical protein
MNGSWDSSLRARGVPLAEWLEQNCRMDNCTQTVQRRMSDWRKGGSALFWTVDELLTKMGRHVSELPPEVWFPAENKTRNYLDRDHGPATCPQCGEGFILRRRTQTYCSRRCQHAGMMKARRAA